MTYSEHEHEFTFAKKRKWIYGLWNSSVIVDLAMGQNVLLVCEITLALVISSYVLDKTYEETI